VPNSPALAMRWHKKLQTTQAVVNAPRETVLLN